MKTTLSMLLFISIVFFLSCNKNSDGTEVLKQVTSSSKVDTVIFAVDTLQYNFGSFGVNEELSVIKQPSHSKLFELLTKQNGARILHYAPKDEFLGIDSVVVLTKRIAKETEQFIKIDSVLIIIRTVKNITHKKLIGTWILTSICGGYTGGCDSVDTGNATQIEFGYNMVYTASYKGSTYANFNYYLIDSIGLPYICVIDTFVEDVVENKYVKRYFKLSDEDHLTELQGYLYSIYSRVKE